MPEGSTLRPARRSLIITSCIVLAVTLTTWLMLRRPGWGPHLLPSRLRSVPAEVHIYDLGGLVRVGPKRLIVVRFLGPVDLRPVTYEHMGLKSAAPIGVWAERLAAPILFNAGQFDANRRYLGWLKGGGTWLSQSRKAGWQGLLVTTPRGVPGAATPGPYGQIVDLNEMSPQEARAVADTYDNVCSR